MTASKWSSWPTSRRNSGRASSRTSENPTSVYLAHRGVKAANVPLVPNVPLPPELFAKDHPPVVGLTISADRLVHIRKNRLVAMKNRAPATTPRKKRCAVK